ncbi:MAG: hypothetical protein KDD33_12405 [Bdellovibrionales bacterium]|nr:hypothetical protein [Bdellovibrionales bacterium]
MLFKGIFKKSMVALLLSSFALAGCSYFLKEKKKEQVIAFDKNDASCMSHTNRIIHSYFHDLSDDEKTVQEVKNLSDCYQISLEAFVKYTKSGDLRDNHYKVEHFAQFLEDFYPAFDMKMETLQGFMGLKRFLFGGDKDSVSKAEITQISQFIEVMSQAMINMAPFRQLLFQKDHLEKTEQGRGQFLEAFSFLRQNVGDVLYNLKPYSGQRSMDLNDMGGFIFSEIYNQTPEESRPMVKMFVSFKNLVLNENHEYLNNKDLSLFVQHMIYVYEGKLDYEYFIKDEELFPSLGSLTSFITDTTAMLKVGQLFKGPTLQALKNVYYKAHRVFKQSAMRSKDQEVSVDKLNKLLLDMEGAGVIRGNLKAKTLGIFLSRFLEKWVAPGQGKVSPHITLAKIDDFKLAIDDWSYRQELLNAKYENTDNLSLTELGEGTNYKDPKMNSWFQTLGLTHLHQYTDNYRLTFSGDLDNFSYEEATVSNAFFTIVSLFMRPFSQDQKNPLAFAINQDAAQEVYELLRILGAEMGFMDSRVYDSGYRAFDEGNHFTTQRRPDDKLDFLEAYELMSILFSSGVVSSELYGDMPEEFRLDYKDVLHTNVVKVEPFRTLLLKNFDKYFNHLQSVSRFWKSDDDKKLTIGMLELATRGGVISKKAVDMGEIRVLVSIMYYLESVFYNFDTNPRDGFATGDEIWAAEVQFRSLVSDFILKSLPEDKSSAMETAKKYGPAIFTYILHYGEIPSSDWKGAYWLWRWNNGHKIWVNSEAKVTPRDVLQVFATLGQATNQSHRTEIHKFLLNNRSALFQEMKSEEVPDCRVKRELLFCRWSRLVNCNENINSKFYSWMRDTQIAIFPESEWEDDPSKAIEKSIKRLSESMRSHKDFSTKCGFPDIPYEKGMFESITDGTYEFFMGNEDKPGVWNQFKEWF